MLFQQLRSCKRSALQMTDTKLRPMADAAITGDDSDLAKDNSNRPPGTRRSSINLATVTTSSDLTDVEGSAVRNLRSLVSGER
jgi:hypothetical protein